MSSGTSPPDSAGSAPAVQTVGLSKTYGDQSALDGVDLRVPGGSVFGLVGPNGAGKTTLLSILAGLRRPSAGSVRLSAERRRVAILPDTPLFDHWLTAAEVVDLARNLVAPDVPEERVAEVLDDAGLSEAANRRVGGFSRGMLQRLGLAATVVGEPQILLLDEPCSALDPAGRREVLDLVTRLASSGNATVVLSTHILADVQEVCDTVGVLRDGRLLRQGPLDDLLVGQASPAYTVRVVPPIAPVAEALRREPWVTRVDQVGAEDLVVGARSLDEASDHLVAALAACGARVVRLEPRTPDLETVFLELTS